MIWSMWIATLGFAMWMLSDILSALEKINTSLKQLTIAIKNGQITKKVKTDDAST